jgi:hypothetical protein
MRKKSILGSLMMGPIGHVAVNALGRAAHHQSNLSEVLAHKGLQHGLLDAVVNPGAMRTMKSVMGPESATAYEAAHAVGRRLAQMKPQERQAAIDAAASAKSTSAPILGHIQKAMAHEKAGTTPSFKGEGVAAKMYGGAADLLTNIVNKPFDTGLQRVVKTVSGAAPLAALTAAEPVGMLSHAGINAVREGVSRSATGKKFIQQSFKAGLGGHKLPQSVETTLDYAVSPALLDPYRSGRTLRAEATPAARARLTPANVDKAHDTISASLQNLRRTMEGQP